MSETTTTATARQPIDLTETVTVSIPGDRGRGDWAKELTAVDAKAKDGTGYEGPWLSVGADADLEPGAVYLRVRKEDRRNRFLAVLVCVLPGQHAANYRIAESGEPKGWAQELRKGAREWLALPREERCRRAAAVRAEAVTAKAAELRALLAGVADGVRAAAAEDKASYLVDLPGNRDWVYWTKGDEATVAAAVAKVEGRVAAAVAACEAELADLRAIEAAAAGTVDPKAAAVARVRALMAELGVTVGDLS